METRVNRSSLADQSVGLLRLPGRLAASLAEHRALMQALHRQDADAAEQVMRDHLLAQLAALREMSLAAEAVHG